MSIADALRAEQIERLKRLDVDARVELAFALGRRDVALYAAAHAVTEAEARRTLSNTRPPSIRAWGTVVCVIRDSCAALYHAKP
ncbi:MAG TPA: hypothetical protein VJR89_14385 [Polyangiales bacterium]|nr:hypothetical protein [Polyangiales bacterium]